ncbi:hypothetical protein SESBI_46554 [Sesbania bispinosa]|nr:hypothetical protein SESBI_46554 [Sesbania bispinosa]
MASPPQNSDITFPPADVSGTLNPGKNTQVQVDPVSSEVAATKEIKFYVTLLILSCVLIGVMYVHGWLKKQAEAKQKKKETEKKDALQTLKSAVIISGIVVAVVGAAFAITKKLREK